ncbi:UNVERIFIED_CONTAM: hypothetical protein FKN15_062190 [Acipenser sinensis]
MAGVFVVLTAFLLCVPDLNGIKIAQSPPSLFESPERSAELQCSHDDSSYDRMYWYQQTRNGALELIGPQSGIGVSQTPQVLLQGAGGSAGMFCEHDGGFDYKQMYWYLQLRGQGIQLLVFSVFGSDTQFEKDFSEERYEVNRSAVTKGSLKIKNLEPDSSDGIIIVQSPPSLFESPGHSAELQCYHDDNNYPYMYWYQQTSKGALELIGYLQNAAIVPEEKFKLRFNLSGDARKAGSVTIPRCCEYHAGLYSLYTMAGVFVVLTAFLLCLPDVSDGINIVQSPPSLIESPGRSAELNCSHDDSSYKQMYWYHQTSKGALELIGYLNYKDVKPEEKFKKRFNLTGDGSKAGPSQGIGVSQTPQVLLQGAGGSAGIFCEHDGGISYNEMYWYRQLRGQGIQLLVFSMFGSALQFEKDFNEERYEVNRPTATKGSLKIKKLETGDSALYFCSACCAAPLSPAQAREDGWSFYCVHGIAAVSPIFEWYEDCPVPPSLIKSPERSAELNCSHDDNNYDKMYWPAVLLLSLQHRHVKMAGVFIVFTALLLCLPGPSQGIGVSQTPQVLLQGAGGSAGMFCEHDGGIEYNQMYWYRQLRGQGIQLLVFSDFYKDPEFEKDFSKDRYEVNRSAVTKGSLKIKNLEPDLNGIKIDQSPPSLLESPGRSAELNCSHDDSNYDKMYWYQQTRKGVLELIAYQYGTTTHEEKFKKRFKMTVKATEKGFLTISNLTAEDSAVYFCAASIHSAADHLSPLQ